MWYKILYIFFIVSSIVFGGITVLGPFSIRHLSLVSMIPVLLINKQYIKNGFNKYIKLYLLFLFCLGIGSITNGFGNTFLKYILSHYLFCFIGIWATIILINKYNAFDVFIKTMIVIGVIDVFITYFQFTNHMWAFAIPDILRTYIEEDRSTLIDTMSGNMLGISMPGLFNPVDNGYYISIITIFSLFYYSRTRKIYTLLIFIFFLFGLYMIQQRSALLSSLALSFLFLVKNMTQKNRVKYICIIIFLIIFFYANGNDFSYLLNDSRFENMLDMSSRDALYEQTIDYLKDNIFNPNVYYFSNKYNIGAHNLFFNLLLYGGIIGGSACLYIIVSLCLKAIIIFNNNKKYNSVYILAGLGFISYNFISIMHNRSIVSGDMFYWIIAVPLMMYRNLKNNKIKQ